MPHRAPRPALVLALGAAMLAGACGAGTATTGPSSAPPSVVPSPTPVASPAADAIDHPAGATDVVLRAETRGGFVRLETVMSRVPEFTLYGDGRALVLPDAAGGGVDPGGGGLNPGAGGGSEPEAGPPLREVRLTDDEVQQVLAFALTDGHLGVARETYMGGNMDAPSTVFEIHAGGVDKTVLVTGLSSEPAPGPEAADLIAFSSLVAKLRSIPTTADYAPPAFVAVIAETESNPAAAANPWPWPDLAPAAFVQPGDADAIPFPKHVLDAAQVAALGVDVGPGGLTGLNAKGPDGRSYLLAILPALPETAPGS